MKGYFKGSRTLGSTLDAFKDKDAISQKSGVGYRFRRNSTECNNECKGESGRTFRGSFKDFQQAPSPINGHRCSTGHNTL